MDVNAGVPGIDEKSVIVNIVKALQGITDAPLQIDSGDPEVIEAALRVYSGKAIVNSVNGEEKSLTSILPLVKKIWRCRSRSHLGRRWYSKDEERELRLQSVF